MTRRTLVIAAAIVTVVAVAAPAASASNPVGAAASANGLADDGALLSTDGNTTDENLTSTNTTDGNVTDGNTTDGNATDGNATASFGARVSAYVHMVLKERPDGGIGRSVAEFVLANNPGDPPEHAGPPAEKPDRSGGNTTDAASEDGDRRGPPAHAGPGNGKGEDGARGPPR